MIPVKLQSKSLPAPIVFLRSHNCLYVRAVVCMVGVDGQLSILFIPPSFSPSMHGMSTMFAVASASVTRSCECVDEPEQQAFQRRSLILNSLVFNWMSYLSMVPHKWRVRRLGAHVYAQFKSVLRWGSSRVI